MLFGGFWKILEEIKFQCNTVRSSQVRHETDIAEVLRRLDDLEDEISSMSLWCEAQGERHRTDDDMKNLIKKAMDEYKTEMETKVVKREVKKK